MTPALFLDRDGVINVDKGYVHEVSKFVFRPGIVDIVRGFRALGHKIIVVTNQSGIGRGMYSEARFNRFTRWMQYTMRYEGADVDAVYHCPHIKSDGCQCRKPRPGMILQAAQDHGIDLAASTLIGDRVSDIEAGRAAGVGHLILWREP